MSTQRNGQALFNALVEVDPAFAEKIRGTEHDPFYKDERIPDALRQWQEHLELACELKCTREFNANLKAAIQGKLSKLDILQGAAVPDEAVPPGTGTLEAFLARPQVTLVGRAIPEADLPPAEIPYVHPMVKEAKEAPGLFDFPLKSLAHDNAIQNVKVKLTVWRDHLVIETQNPEDLTYPGWTPVGGTRIGCVIENTKVALGVSEDAFAWLEKVPKSRDAIGDVDWWACTDGMKAFAWLGGTKSIKSRECDGSHKYDVFPGDYVPIPNDPPKEAMVAVDAFIRENSGAQGQSFKG